MVAWAPRLPPGQPMSCGFSKPGLCCVLVKSFTDVHDLRGPFKSRRYGTIWYSMRWYYQVLGHNLLLLTFCSLSYLLLPFRFPSTVRSLTTCRFVRFIRPKSVVEGKMIEWRVVATAMNVETSLSNRVNSFSCFPCWSRINRKYL